MTQKFAASADQFQNLVYEQADSLAGVAKALNLQVQTSDFVTRGDAQRLAFGNAKFVAGALRARIDRREAQHARRSRSAPTR